ncbi:hypothetical protein [Pseudomonas sp. JV241A]|uniref:hypothetical protein n=1 Tax=Pseudomonas sp. JV241A TaxID=2078785 RepID=UPI00100C7145|nr:hypothetical protein [Pseudomonas sp. JV241A]SPO67880.1 protein of unknown function [Pseudomonas sp. JV241A]
MSVVKLIKVGDKFDARWSYELTPDPDSDLHSIRYVLFDDSNGFTLCKVRAWNDFKEIAPNGSRHVWRLSFSSRRGFGSHATNLIDFCGRQLEHQDENNLARLLDHEYTHHHTPEASQPKVMLNLNEARDAVADYYLVDSSQVSITISSR